MFNFTIFLIFLIICCNNSVISQQKDYVLVETLSKLGHPSEVCTCFDGDTIYILGGQGLEGRVFDEIYSYSISSDKIELIGRLPHPLARGACAVSSSRKQLFYAGGKNKDGELVANIYSFDIGNKTSVEIGEEAELRFIGRATQSSSSKNAFILSGDPRLDKSSSDATIWEWDLDDGSMKKIANLPFAMFGDTVAISLAEDDGIIHIVGKDYRRNPPIYSIEQFDPSTKLSSKMSTISWPCDALLPTPSSVWVGNTGYIFIGNGNCTRGFIKWKNNEILQFVGLRNIPSTEEYGWDGVGGVWVEKLNRIYLFGGYVFPKYLDGIWFMEIQNDGGQEKIEL